VLTKIGVPAYIRPLGTPPRLIGRVGVPLKLLTGTVKQHPTVIGCVELRRPFGLPKGGDRKVSALFEK
jgi:hypothetical protein